MLIYVDFWNSMYGYAMDSRTRELFFRPIHNAKISLTMLSYVILELHNFVKGLHHSLPWYVLYER